METSLRCSGGSKSLTIHAKEKFPLGDRDYLQAHGAIEACTGIPSYLALVFRGIQPQFSVNLGVGIQFDKHDKLSYIMRAKKAFPITSNGQLAINVKSGYDFDKEFRERKAKGALELGWIIFNFQKDQDVRIKVGYELFEKGPYFQIRENNWTFNAEMNGKWNVRFDL